MSKSLQNLGWLLSILVNSENKLALFFMLVEVWSTAGYGECLPPWGTGSFLP